MRSSRTALSLALTLLAAPIAIAPAYAAPKADAAKPPSIAPDVKQGVEAWERGEYARAVSIWRPLAIDGDPDAQFNLGQAYKLGRGVPADLSQAEGWYRRAAKQGHLQAEDNLGLVLFTANRRGEAMHFINRSAARGEPRAQYVLGTAMYNGDLAEKDWPRAYALTKRASDAGLGIASARLAQLDQLIPLDQRQRGLAMLPQMEKDEARARLSAVNAAAPPPPAPAPSPVKTASLPVSQPGTAYTPPPVIAPTPVATPAPPPAAPKPAPALTSPAAINAAAAAAEATAAADIATAETRPSPLPPRSAPAPIDGAPTPSQPGAGYPAPEPAPVKAEPQPAPVTAAPVRSAAASPWRAQLGAFSIEANARNLWVALERKNPAFAARQPYLVKGGKLTRLQVGDFADKGEAATFCAKVRKGGQACLVVDR